MSKNETNTPRTDQAQSARIGFFSCATVPASFAATLEIENSALLEDRDALLAALKKAREYIALYGKTSDAADDRDMVDNLIEKVKARGI